MNHIILDMDGTLIGIDNNMKPVIRPFLEDFLVFCFKNYRSVSIWTAANIEWFDVVNEKIFQPILDKYKLSFRFVWDYNKCTRQRIMNYENIYIKKLERVFDAYKDMTTDNTIIIDDNQIICMDNPENSIIIHSYNPDDKEKEDLELKMMMWKLKIIKDLVNVREKNRYI